MWYFMHTYIQRNYLPYFNVARKYNVVVIINMTKNDDNGDDGDHDDEIDHIVSFDEFLTS